MVSGSLMANLETQRARSEDWAATSSAATKTGYKLGLKAEHSKNTLALII